ncbi:peroxiredoxin [Carnimonas nigrificans]|uniref:peroxiredoxin n=1 Tax=Carnimonas nigrificans TaxID=64323 RepID=UPI0004710E45|nr:peroxiredoxin [Carnimonas nigrificans]
MSVSLHRPIDDFTATATHGDSSDPATVRLSDFTGKQLVIYFYPKDSTPGCTTEGLDFAALHDQFSAANTSILGVSRDTLKRHQNFKAKQQFPFELISDEDETLCRAFDVIKLKKLYGKEHYGIERSTFLIDAEGKLAQEWRKVKVKGHVEEVLTAAQQLAAHS